MKTLLAALVITALATPAYAVVIHDEGGAGDLSSDPLNPTPVAFAVGSNTIIGSVVAPSDVRDYITFTIPSDMVVTQINLLQYVPGDRGYSSINAGTTSLIPAGGNVASFLSGVHVDDVDEGTDLLEKFTDESIIPNSLSVAELGPGEYCFLIQQTGPTLTEYTLEFVTEVPVQIEASTWGRMKSLFR